MSKVEETLSKQGQTFAAATAEQLTDARETLSTDWDENGTVSIFMPAAEAVKAALKMGMTFNVSTGAIECDGEIFWSWGDALSFYLTALGS